MAASDDLSSQRFYHGTRADLKPGDLIEPGHPPNFGKPIGPIMDDPNLTDKKYPGNPTRSYRSRDPLRVIGEVTDWQGHSPEVLKAMRENLERLKQLGVQPIDE